MHRLISFLRHCWCWYHIFSLNMHSSFLIKKTIIASQCWGIWLWWRRGVDWEILIRKRLSTGQSNRGHIRWHVWRYNLTRHAIQPDTSGSKTIARNAWSTIKPARSCQAVWSQGAETQLLFQELPFSLLGQVYPKPDRDYHSVPSTTCGDVWVFINREVGRVPYKGPQ